MLKLFHNQITSDQIQELANGLSNDDLMEIEALGWTDPVKAVSTSIDSSETFTYISDQHDKAVGIAGVVSSGKDSGVVWLLTTDVAKQYPFSVVRQSKYWLARQKSEYLLLHNIVDARNTNHLKLLKLLGFKKLRYVPAGPLNRTFIEFATIS